MLTYGERAALCSNQTAKNLFNLMQEKQTNLSFNPDVTNKDEFLSLTQAAADEICVLKTHIDILVDFTPEVTTELQALAKKHQFIIFEDRKFADIGNTVKHQYQDGLYHIADWAPIVNAHALPGQGIVDGIKAGGQAKGNGLLLLAQMSTKDNLFNQAYTDQTIALAKENDDFVIGFICVQRLVDDPRFIHFTPGIKFAQGGDTLGQHYITPKMAIQERGVDIIIVGRDIYQDENPARQAQLYRKAGWDAYCQRLEASIRA